MATGGSVGAWNPGDNLGSEVGAWNPGPGPPVSSKI